MALNIGQIFADLKAYTSQQWQNLKQLPQPPQPQHSDNSIYQSNSPASYHLPERMPLLWLWTAGCQHVQDQNQNPRIVKDKPKPTDNNRYSAKEKIELNQEAIEQMEEKWGCQIEFDVSEEHPFHYTIEVSPKKDDDEEGDDEPKKKVPKFIIHLPPEIPSYALEHELVHVLDNCKKFSEKSKLFPKPPDDPPRRPKPPLPEDVPPDAPPPTPIPEPPPTRTPEEIASKYVDMYYHKLLKEFLAYMLTGLERGKTESSLDKKFKEEAQKADDGKERPDEADRGIMNATKSTESTYSLARHTLRKKENKEALRKRLGEEGILPLDPRQKGYKIAKGKLAEELNRFRKENKKELTTIYNLQDPEPIQSDNK